MARGGTKKCEEKQALHFQSDFLYSSAKADLRKDYAI